MACSACGKRRKLAAERAEQDPSATKAPEAEVVQKRTVALPLAEKSATDKKVKIRYMGGGYSTHGKGCRSCGGTGTKYTFVTSETIAFVSEDSANNYYKNLFTVGHDYYVTEKQAEYLLTLTYMSKAGRLVNKFKKV